MDITKLKQDYYSQKDTADMLCKTLKWMIRKCKPFKDIKQVETQCHISSRKAETTYRKLLAVGGSGFRI